MILFPVLAIMSIVHLLAPISARSESRPIRLFSRLDQRHKGELGAYERRSEYRDWRAKLGATRRICQELQLEGLELLTRFRRRP